MSGNEQTIDHQRLGMTLRHMLPFVRLTLRSLLLTFFFCCPVLLLPPLFALAGALARVTVPAKVSLSGDKVTLGSLLALVPADAKLAAELDTVVLTAAPAPGQTKVLPAVEILRRMESVGITTKTHVIAVPTEVAIVREAQTVTPAEISQRVIEEFLPGLPWKEVRLERIDVVETILLPKGKTEWIFNCHPGTDYAKPFFLNINFSVNGEIVKRAFLRTMLSVREQVAVAITELKPNQSIGGEDLRWESQRLLSTLQTPIKSNSFFCGRRPRMAIPAGRVLTENLFVPVPLVKRGDSLLLVFESSSMRVTTQAKALAMGFRGQRIQVMNPESGRVLSAEITDEGTARVVQ